MLGSGIDDLDGVAAWDGDCFATSFGEGVVEIAAGGLATVGLWVALVGWARGRRWWRHGVAVIAVGLGVFVIGAATLNGATTDLPAARCSGAV